MPGTTRKANNPPHSPFKKGEVKKSLSHFTAFAHKTHRKTNSRFLLSSDKEVIKMIGWAITFLIISVIAGLLGFTGIAGAAVWMAKALFGIFLLMFIIFLALGYTIFKKIT